MPVCRAVRRRDRQHERAAVGVAAAAGVPVRSATGVKRVSSLARLAQRGVDGLLLRADQADRDLALLKREDLRPQHRGVGDADQLELARLGQAAGDDEEPRAVGRAVHVRRLDLAVDAAASPAGRRSKSSSVVGASASMMYSSGYL